MTSTGHLTSMGRLTSMGHLISMGHLTRMGRLTSVGRLASTAGPLLHPRGSRPRVARAARAGWGVGGRESEVRAG